MDCGTMTRIAIEDVEEEAMKHFEEDMAMEGMEDVAHIRLQGSPWLELQIG